MFMCTQAHTHTHTRTHTYTHIHTHTHIHVHTYTHIHTHTYTHTHTHTNTHTETLRCKLEQAIFIEPLKTVREKPYPTPGVNNHLWVCSKHPLPPPPLRPHQKLTVHYHQEVLLCSLPRIGGRAGVPATLFRLYGVKAEDGGARRVVVRHP